MSTWNTGTMTSDRFDADALTVAPTLLGAVLGTRSESGSVLLRITEVEAYHGIGIAGSLDESSHASRRITARNAAMFGPPGHAYVYFTYGMHFAMNIVCSPQGLPSAVLIRSGEVIEGIALARARRSAKRSGSRPIPDHVLASGPGNLATVLGLTRAEHDGQDLRCPPFLFRDGDRPVEILSGPRVGITSSVDFPWRFWTPSPTVSNFRAGRI